MKLDELTRNPDQVERTLFVIERRLTFIGDMLRAADDGAKADADVREAFTLSSGETVFNSMHDEAKQISRDLLTVYDLHRALSEQAQANLARAYVAEARLGASFIETE